MSKESSRLNYDDSYMGICSICHLIQCYMVYECFGVAGVLCQMLWLKFQNLTI